MKATETRLELFKQIIVREVRMDLDCNYSLKSFGEKWKVGNGTFSRILGSAPCFLRIGVIAAVLKDEGTTPEERDDWMILVIKEDREKDRL